MTTQQPFLYSENFNDGILNTSGWTYFTRGTGAPTTQVTEHDGYLDIQTQSTDRGGQALLTFASGITDAHITMDRYSHGAGSYFFPAAFMTFRNANGEEVVVDYLLNLSLYGPDNGNNPANYDHPKIIIAGGTSYSFYFAQGVTTSSLLDKWVTTDISVDSTNGTLNVDVDHDGFTDIFFADSRLVGAQLESILFDSYGWFTGHYTYLDNLVVTGTVAAAAPNVAPVIDATSAVAGSVADKGASTVSGTMTATDPGDTLTWSTPPSGADSAYGLFAISASGVWTYTLDTAAASHLGAGQSVTETFAVAVTDAAGATDSETVSIVVQGANDAPVIGGSNFAYFNNFNDGVLASPGWTYFARMTGAPTTQVSEHDGYLDIQTQSTDTGGEALLTLPEGVSNAHVSYDHFDHAATENFFSGVTMLLKGAAGQDVYISFHMARSTYAPDYGNNPANYDHPKVIISDATGYTFHFAQGLTTTSLLDTWVTSDISIDSTTGAFALDVNHDGVVDISFSDARLVGASLQSLQFDAYGWFTGHYSHLDNLSVTGGGNGPSNLAGTVDAGSGVTTAGGALTASDADTSDVLTWSTPAAASDSPYGSFAISAGGVWTYTMDAAAASHLGAGQTAVETFSVVVSDDHGGTDTETVSITVVGANDAPVIGSGSVVAGSVAEGGSGVVSGAMAVTDADTGDLVTWSTPAGASDSPYGSFAISAGGVWTYTMDAAAASHLGAGQTAVETFSVVVSDDHGGTDTETVSITVVGANDAPVIGSGSVVAGSVAEGGSGVVSGAMAVTDADTGDLVTWSTPAGASDSPYGSFAISAGGVWTYTMDAAAASHLNPGQTVQEVFVVTAKDGSNATATQTVTITIVGTLDDALSVTGANGNDKIVGGNNADTISGGNGNDTIIGGAGDDYISGDNGTDSLSGVKGNDILKGGNGADTLQGGNGDDTMTGGSGPDRFVFFGSESAGDHDVITDFENADRIVLSQFGAINMSSLSITQTGANTTVLVHSLDALGHVIAGADLSILLQGISAASVSSSAFIFG